MKIPALLTDHSLLTTNTLSHAHLEGLWWCSDPEAPQDHPEHDQGTVEVCSDIYCCSWCNRCAWHHLCNIKLKWWIRDHPTLLTNRSKHSTNAKGWNDPNMCKRGHCAGECQCLSRTWSLHTGLQLSTWNRTKYMRSNMIFYSKHASENASLLKLIANINTSCHRQE